MLIVGFVIAQIILLGIIIFVLKRLIFSDTNSAINRLTKIDNLNREKEKLLMRKLEQAEKYIEEQKVIIKETEQKMKQEAKRAASQMHEDVIKKAKEEGEEIIKKASSARETIRSEAMIEAESKMIDICTQILNQVLATVLDQNMHEKLIQQFLSELEKADLDKVGQAAENVELVSAQEMPSGDQEKIKQILQVKLNRDLPITSNVDANLIGGVMLKLGSMVVDASLAERFREVGEQLKKELNWKYAV